MVVGGAAVRRCADARCDRAVVIADGCSDAVRRASDRDQSLCFAFKYKTCVRLLRAFTQEGRIVSVARLADHFPTSSVNTVKTNDSVNETEIGEEK